MTVRSASLLTPSYTPATINDLPKELFPLTFSFLTPSEIPKVSLTCHKWLDASKSHMLKESFFKQAMQDKLPLKEVCFLAWLDILNRSQEYTNISLLCLRALNLAPCALGSEMPFRIQTIVEFGKFFSEKVHPQLQLPDSRSQDRNISLLCLRPLTLAPEIPRNRKIPFPVQTILAFGRFFGRKIHHNYALASFGKLKLESLDEACPYTQFIKGVWCLSRAIQGEIVSEKDLEKEQWQTCARGIQGRYLLEAASDAGIADANYFIAMYAEPRKEDDETIHWDKIKDAATKGSLLAYHSLAMLGIEGMQGLESYQRSAAKAGHVYWQLSIGTKLIDQEKYEEAVEWIGKAAMQNNQEAKIKLVKLLARRTPGTESYLDQLKADGLDFIMML